MQTIRTLIRASLAGVVTLAGLAMALPGGTAQASAPRQLSSAYWLGEYFDNATLSGSPVLLRTSRQVLFNWGKGSPSRRVPSDNFSARYSRPLKVAAGSYVLRARADDGVRVYVDNRLVIDEWRDGPARDSSVTLNLGGEHLFRVEYYERTGDASVRLQLLRADAPQASTAWRAEFYNNAFLSGQPAVVRSDATINFDFGGGSPAAGVNADNFSARWTRRINFAPGYYVFNARVDDGVRVYVGDRIVIDQFVEGGQRDVNSASIFVSGETPVRVEYFDKGGGAVIRFSYSATASPQSAPTATPIPFFADWRGEYYNNIGFQGAPVLVRNDRTISFNYGAGSPDPRVPVDNFAARWTRNVSFAPGTYRFRATVDDGVRVTVGGRVIIDALVEGAPRQLTGDATVNGPTDVVVEYIERGGSGLIDFSWDALNTGNDWRGEYFNNAGLQGSPAFVRNDAAINFEWGLAAPDARVSNDNFSVRWTKRQTLAAGTYNVDVAVDDGIRVFVNGNLIIDQWFDGPTRTASGTFSVGAGEHELRVEYYERAGGATARVNINALPVGFPTAAP